MKIDEMKNFKEHKKQKGNVSRDNTIISQNNFKSKQNNGLF